MTDQPPDDENFRTTTLQRFQAKACPHVMQGGDRFAVQENASEPGFDSVEADEGLGIAGKAGIIGRIAGIICLSAVISPLSSDAPPQCCRPSLPENLMVR